MVCAEASSILSDCYSPDILLCQMWVYSMGRPFYEYFGHVPSCKRYTIGMVNQNYSGFIINELETYLHSGRFEAFVQSRGNKSLSKGEKEELNSWFSNRMEGSHAFHKGYGGFLKFQEKGKIEQVLQYDKTKRNLFMFPNIFWDYLGWYPHVKPGCKMLFHDYEAVADGRFDVHKAFSVLTGHLKYEYLLPSEREASTSIITITKPHGSE